MADVETSHGSRPMPDFVRKGLIRVSGNLYLKASHCVLWFRDEHPDWSIATEIVQVDENFALMKATVSDDLGRVLATGHKSCARAAFPAGWIEKAESGAVARALSFLGYGTEFGELEEEGTGVESAAPQRRTAPQSASASEPMTAEQRRAILSLCNQKGVEIPENLETMTQGQAGELLTTLQRKAA